MASVIIIVIRKSISERTACVYIVITNSNLDGVAELWQPLNDHLSPIRPAVASPKVEAHDHKNDENEQLRTFQKPQLAS